MTILQPSQLTQHFDLEQELYLQDDLKNQFTGLVKPGFFTLVWETEGRFSQKYWIGFLVEVPNTPTPFIIEVYLSPVTDMTRDEFESEVDKLSEKAEQSPNRTLAITLFRDRRNEILKERLRLSKQIRKN